MERRAAGDKNWEPTFLAPETWRNLRITCRGFLSYCRSVIEYAAAAPPQSIPKFYGINMAHSNSSVIEAWFSAVRNSNQDSTPRYAHFVANKEMKKAMADQAVRRNKMYNKGDIGEVRTGKFVGPSEFIKYHLAREMKMTDTIAQAVPLQQEARKTYIDTNILAAAFSPDCVASLPKNLSALEIDVANKLSFKILKKGYLGELMDQEYFQQWMRLSFNTPTGKWFYEYHRSPNFVDLCTRELPPQLGNNHPGCVMLCLCLARMHSCWLDNALFQVRKAKDPKKFQKPINRYYSTIDQTCPC